MEISVISNHFVEKYLNDGLRKLFSEKNENVKITSIPQEVFAQEEYRENYGSSELIVIWLDLEFLFPIGKNISMLSNMEVDMVWNLLTQINNHCIENSQGQVIWISFDKNHNDWRYCGCLLSDVNPADELNYRLMKQFKNATVIDLNQVIAMEGIEQAYSRKHVELWNVKYGKKVMRRLVYEIYKQDRVQHGRMLKCIVTDCDNVLWRGILSEDGMDHVVSDGIHRLYQGELLKLYQRGIILCIASKNDKVDVEEVLKPNGKMILSRLNFACMEVNWGDKVESLQRISDTLNIGLESILFVDDSPLEIENVNQRMSEVSTCLFDQNVLSKLSMFHLKLSIDADSAMHRQMTYKDNVKRTEAKNQTQTYEDYLKTLDSKIMIEPAKEKDVNRIAELTQRTNKLTNGMRFTVQELLKKLKEDHVYKVSLSDRFGDLGVVGAMSVSSHGDSNRLDVYCLSCRALGRNVERQMTEFIQRKERIKSFCFIDTGKNGKVKTMLEEIGEIACHENDTGGQNSCLLR